MEALGLDAFLELKTKEEKTKMKNKNSKIVFLQNYQPFFIHALLCVPWIFLFSALTRFFFKFHYETYLIYASGGAALLMAIISLVSLIRLTPWPHQDLLVTKSEVDLGARLVTITWPCSLQVIPLQNVANITLSELDFYGYGLGYLILHLHNATKIYLGPTTVNSEVLSEINYYIQAAQPPPLNESSDLKDIIKTLSRRNTFMKICGTNVFAQKVLKDMEQCDHWLYSTTENQYLFHAHYYLYRISFSHAKKDWELSKVLMEDESWKALEHSILEN
jgi:hypothetical protein